MLTGLASLIAAGKLSTPIQATYDVAQIKEAVTAAAGQREGKILITPSHG
jgi:trans-2-enoyl-CoA reductase